MTKKTSDAFNRTSEQLAPANSLQDIPEPITSELNIGLKVVLFLALFAGLYISSLYSYILFHGIAEIFAISVGACIFVITWNSRRFIQNGYLLFIGIAYFFAAVIDFVHTLAHKGMGVFIGYDANLPTQLWICARYLQSISLLIAPVFFRFKPNVSIVMATYSVIIIALLLSVFAFSVFPDCYVDGVGLTRFKIISEYIICAILLVSLFLLSRNRSHFEPKVFRLLMTSIVITVFSELSFTSYVSVYGFFNLIGHFLKIVAFYLIYKAIVETGLKYPYSLIFRELDQERQRLRQEIEARRQLQEELQRSAEKYTIVADFAHDWEYWIDPDGHPVYVSPSCGRVTGYTAEEFMSNPDLMKDIVFPEDRELVNSHFIDHHNHGELLKSCNLDFKILTRNKETRWINHVCQPVYGKNGDYLGRRASNRDITDRKLAEEAKTELISELEKAMTEIKTLRGFIPICSSCKKIRDDQGFWQAVEVYIRARTDAQFSHSICPECAKKLYPELYSEE